MSRERHALEALHTPRLADDEPFELWPRCAKCGKLLNFLEMFFKQKICDKCLYGEE